MAIKSDSSGGLTTLSFESHIVPEFVTDNATPSSLRPHSLSEYYVDGGLVPDASPQNDNIPTTGPIQFSNFYGAVNVIKVEFFELDTNNNYYLDKDGVSVTVSKSSTADLYNIADTFVSNVSGEQNVPFEFIIDSDACFNSSMRSGGYFGDLTITNKGIIAGRGGNGGSNGGNGNSGTAAIRITHNADKITIDNLGGGIIAGGGGGGRGDTVSAYGSTARAGGGGGWNGGDGGNSNVSGLSGSDNSSGGNGNLVKSKSDANAGGDGEFRARSDNGINGGLATSGTGGLGGGGGGGNHVGSNNEQTLNDASAGSGGGGGNKIVLNANGGSGGGYSPAFAPLHAGGAGGSGGTNTNSGSSASAAGGGGGWGAAGGGSGSNGGKALQRTGTVTSITYTTSSGTYYGTKDT